VCDRIDPLHQVGNSGMPMLVDVCLLPTTLTSSAMNPIEKYLRLQNALLAPEGTRLAFLKVVLSQMWFLLAKHLGQMKIFQEYPLLVDPESL
jgi:hypothetical protein